MIVRIIVNYQNAEQLKKLTRDQWNELGEAIPQLRLDFWPDTSDKAPSWWRYDDDMYLDSRQLPMLEKNDLQYTVKAIKNSYITKQKDESTGETVNINIALPNIGLLMIDEVTWKDDSCTEVIQSMLDEGWRILAICPPNGARRPDYILGRTKK